MGRLDLKEVKEEFMRLYDFSDEYSDYMIHYIRKLCDEHGAKTVMEEDTDLVFNTIKRDMVKHMEYKGGYKNKTLLVEMIENLRTKFKVCDNSYYYVLFVFQCVNDSILNEDTDKHCLFRFYS